MRVLVVMGDVVGDDVSGSLVEVNSAARAGNPGVAEALIAIT